MLCRAWIFLLFVFLPAAAYQSPPVSQIPISDVSYSQQEPDKFLLTGRIENPTPETREVVFRGRLAFFDKTAPKGDRPIFVLRKDATVILRPGESRNVEMLLINEGGMPRGAVRIEPVIRVRRQRIWNY